MPILCSSCKYYTLSKSGRHECHAHPPEFHIHINVKNAPVETWEFPEVDPENDHVCMDYKE